MNERVSNTHSKGERVKIPLLQKQSKIKERDNVSGHDIYGIPFASKASAFL